MQKFLAQIMSLILAFIGTIFPGIAQPLDTYSEAQWLEIVASEFAISADLQDGDNYFTAEKVAPATLTDAQVAAIEACYDWDVIDDAIDYDDMITNAFVAATLVKMTKLDAAPAAIANSKKLKDADAIAVAVSLGLVELELTGRFKVRDMAKDAAIAALDTAKHLDANRSYGAAKGDIEAGANKIDLAGDYKMVGEQGALQMQSADGAVLVDNSTEIGDVNFSGSFNPFAADATGISPIEEQGLLEKIKLSFSIGGVKIKVDPTDTGIDLSVGGSIKGINIEKAYELSNFDIETEFEGNLKEKTIDYAYIAMNYDLKDITKVSGSYATSLVDTQPGDTETDFFGRIQQGIYEFQSGGDSVINVFSVAVAVPNCPAITFNIDLKVIITFDGKVEIIVNSHESKGYVVENNKARALNNDCDPEDTYVDILANVTARIGVNLSARIVNITILDIEVDAGLGVKVQVILTGGASTKTIDIPVDFLFDIAFAYPNAENTEATGRIKVYGIVNISIGKQSPILKKLGLTKTWNLVNEGNGTFIDVTIDESGVYKTVAA